MLLLILFAFAAGIVTILSPCILPILPIILSGSVGNSKKRPMGIVLGFIASFTFFTLFLAAIVSTLNISADIVRNISVVILIIFGLSLISPVFQKISERIFSKLSQFIPRTTQSSGFWSGILIGLSLGLVWTPCVGPIIASVITLAAASQVSSDAVFITLAYSLGTAIPMFAIMIGGRGLLQKVPWLTRNTQRIQKVFGLILILTAVGIFFGVERKFQAYILEKFPAYGTGLTQFEEQPTIKEQLKNLQNSNKKSSSNSLQRLFSNSRSAPELILGGEWINSKPLKMSELKGKVVLVDFWTYTCINCIRTLPYLKAWDEKYRDDGLFIIGVHTPEFAFERDTDNVKKAVKDFEIMYPVMQDNDYATWNAYDNHYWPAKYLINKDGEVVYTHFGEGKYDETEEKIQALLKEAGSQVSQRIDNPRYKVDADTPELYLGYGRMQALTADQHVTPEQPYVYKFPATTKLHSFSFNGNWLVTKEYSQAKGDKTALRLAFKSKDVYLVMRSKNPGVVNIYLDGQLVQSGAGDDVINGTVTVTTNRLYHLIHLSQSGEHNLELRFDDPDIEIYAFTFG